MYKLVQGNEKTVFFRDLIIYQKQCDITLIRVSKYSLSNYFTGTGTTVLNAASCIWSLIFLVKKASHVKNVSFVFKLASNVFEKLIFKMFFFI